MNSNAIKTTLIDEVMTFGEGARRWGKAESTLRMMIRTGKLIEGIDYRKSGGTWLITREAMEKAYGKEIDLIQYTYKGGYGSNRFFML